MAVIDLSILVNDFQSSAQNPATMFWFIFRNGGWLGIVFTFLVGFRELWREWIQTRYINKNYTGKFVLLAIDVPKNSEQTPKAAEQMFAHFAGISKGPIFSEKWGLPFTEFFSYGFVAPSMSIEIVSLGGYVQFFARCLIVQRDIIEASIYAQYPDAEVTEVEDYVDLMPNTRELPHPEWDCWSVQLTLHRHSAYPIRTYPFFEHGLSQKLIDPIGSLMEIMSRMSPDEQMWVQFVIGQDWPPDEWREPGARLVNKLIGKKVKEKAGLFNSGIGSTIVKDSWEAATATLLGLTPDKDTKKRDDPPSLMLHLSPGERDIVTQMQMKMSKVAFKVKGRYIYWGKTTPGPDGIKPFNKARGANGFLGWLKQFAISDSNFFTLSKATKTGDIIWFKNMRMLDRKRRNLYNYRNRSIWRGRKEFYLNVEELATIFHFPTIDVKAAQVLKTETKRASAPTSLPVENPLPIQRVRSTMAIQRAAPPSSIPTPGVQPTHLPAAPTQPPPGAPIPPPEPQVPTNLPFVD
ncbi:MAG: hypothetical protein Q8O51_02275 [bacterium]|nr:hypothetical protein [bacterium]